LHPGRTDESHGRDARTDGLRGLGIALVLLLHFHLSYRLTESPLATVLGAKIVRTVAVNGNYGVTMFFAISGFLITRTALRRWGGLGDIPLRDFYILRGARIVPPLLLALAIIVPLGLGGHPSFRNVHHPAAAWFVVAAGSVLTFWHNLLMQSAGYFNYALNVYWSLSVEEVFYLAFPVACVLLGRERRIAVACALLIVAGPIYRYLHRDNEIYFLYANLACCDAIAIGILAALVAPRIRRHGGWVAALAQALGAALVVTTYIRGIRGNEVFGFTAMAAGTATLLVWGAPHRPSDPRPSRLVRIGLSPLRSLRWCGRHSYELYLFHIIVLGLLRVAVPRASVSPAAKLGWLLVYLASSVAVAGLVAYGYAGPLNERLRRELIGAKSKTPVDADDSADASTCQRP
jgi:peptidoglycan/LPS O-acetylase OafA/YrhL